MVVGDIPTAVEVVIIGAGPGGYVAAIRAAQLGKQVTLIDPAPPGGTCLHQGCIPSKALLAAADRACQVQHLAAMGITTGPAQIDFARMQQWKDGIVARLGKGVQQILAAHKVDVVRGTAWFTPEGQIWAAADDGTHRFLFEHCIIATGAAAARLPALPFGERVWSPATALSQTALPTKMAIYGADGSAAEVATIFAKLGTTVRLLVPVGRSLLDQFDPLAGKLVAANLQKLGVQIQMGVPAPTEPLAMPLVVSDGVLPRTGQLDLQHVGVGTDERGFICTDDRMRTSNPVVAAVGDVTGGSWLASVAIKQGKVAAEAIGGVPTQYCPQAVPHVVWTDPEVAAVGLTAAEAEAAGHVVTTGRFPLAANGRALTLNAGDGVVQIVAERNTGVLLGVLIVGTRASDLIGEAALALEMGATVTDLAETLHPHPGLGETLSEAAERVLGVAVHVR